ncbi:alpha/beta hydrolase [Paractinoplanes rishiriensis]|uniref:Peptidase n=1 Tax=Paractinoplanes rishiriensis TaxID=1050105 RepID=A0A919N0E4_9ACTN|nr:alpha/beta hydrolase [Actinoplanes rishiriensis]GIE95002.1 peptidase [Actinoplanes rishiriensis]
MSLTSRLLAAGAAGLVLAGTLIAPTPVAAAPAADSVVSSAAWARTSATERRRVDRVATPKLRWYGCYGWAQCATVKVPLDYDRPRGKQVTLALLRVKARDQKNRIGSLFVNPGGPGGSSVAMALAAPYFLSDSLLDRFDVVGMDPRGIGFSDQVNCFGDTARQTPTMNVLNMGFPLGAAQEKAFTGAAAKAARACSTTGRELAGAMSTAEVARDMDVMRRAVGDSKLTYLGFSYGTALGQYYANMFPDRFRAIAVDGVINPRAWVGSAATAGQVQDDRLRSADGAWKAFVEIMRRCDAAGPAKCRFSGSPLHRFRVIAERLKKKPIDVGSVRVTYAVFIGAVLGALYEQQAGAEVTDLSAELYELTTPGFVPTADRTASAEALVKRMVRQAEGRAFPYDNSFDAYAAVMCTDGRHPARGSAWPKASARADKRATYFGRAWAWASVQCAGDNWTVRDEDAYTGPFTKQTRHPVLVVGNFWDPATNYADAVKASRLLPNSRLLSSNNWGHTAYGSSACATGTTDRYLLYRALPAPGTTCVGDEQPFRKPLPSDATAQELTAQQTGLDLRTATPAEIAAHGLPATGADKVRPPVH